MTITLMEGTGDPASRFCQAMIHGDSLFPEPMPCLEPVSGRIIKIKYTAEREEKFSVCDSCFHKIVEAQEA